MNKIMKTTEASVLKAAGADKEPKAKNSKDDKKATAADLNGKTRGSSTKSATKKTKATEAKRRGVTHHSTKKAKTERKASSANQKASTANQKASSATLHPEASQATAHSSTNYNENNGKRKSPKVLAIDIGGTKVKMLLNGEMEPRKAPTGKEFTPLKLLEAVELLTADWDFDSVTIGFPGLVGPNGPLAEPGNLGPGWVGFDFAGAFKHPVKIVNDASMQAVGSYEGGRMLFIGLGTGVGSTLIVDHVILAIELGVLRWDSSQTIGELLAKRSIKKIGMKRWRSAVHDVVQTLMKAFVADYVVVGGGNAKLLDNLPAGARVGHNQTAFRGGYRVWGVDNTSSEDLELHGSWKVL